MLGVVIKDRTRFVFEISNIRTFSRYSIRFEIRKFEAINEYHSNIFLHVLRRKIGSRRYFTF